jgi:type IV pilus assembly protein PilX
MSARIHSHPAPRAQRQRGFILVTGLLFLVVMTMLALAMFRSTGLMDRISANTRDKQRSFEAAQSALQYAEWWLNNNDPGTTTAACTTLASGDTVANIHVCSTALQSDFLTASTWTGGFTYTPPNLAVPSSGDGTGGQVTSSDTASDVIYYRLPGFYVEYVGVSSTKGGNVYRITAYGYGGDANTKSIVRSMYRLPSTYASGGGGGTGLGGP